MTPIDTTQRPRLWDLREWLTLPEAAHYLASILLVAVSEADVLRLALDGHLQLSVRFMRFHDAKSTDHPERAPRGVGGADGVYDLPLPIHTAEREAIERRYQRLTNGPELPVDEWPFFEGICVVVQSKADEAGTRVVLLDEATACGQAVDLPDDATLVVRTAALRSFEERTSSASTESPLDPMSKPLTTRERDTLLTIIDALAAEAGIDVSHATAAGVTIANMIEKRGGDVAANTIAGHLRRLRQTLHGGDVPPPKRRSPKT